MYIYIYIYSLQSLYHSVPKYSISVHSISGRIETRVAHMEQIVYSYVKNKGARKKNYILSRHFFIDFRIDNFSKFHNVTMIGQHNALKKLTIVKNPIRKLSPGLGLFSFIDFLGYMSLKL